MTFDYKDFKVFYQETGQGTPCLLLHGFLENHQIWNPLCDVLYKKYKIVNLDLPGHGASGLPATQWTMDSLAEMLAEFLDHLSISATNVIGHSMGGYIGLAFAKAYPDRVLSLTLLNSSPFKDDPSRIQSRKHGMQLAQKNYPAIVKMSVANLFTVKNRKLFKETIEWLKQEALQTPLEGYITAQTAMMQRPDSSMFFEEIGFKKLLLLVKDDTLIDAEAHLELFKDSSIDIEVISGGHQLLIENFEETIHIVKQFLIK